MNKRRILVLAMVVALVGGLLASGCPAPPPAPPAPAPPAPAPPAPAPPAPPAPEVEVFKWTYLGEHPAGTVYDLWVRDLADRTRLASGGRLDITVTASGEIVPAYEIMTAVRDGVGDLCWGNMVAHRAHIGDVGFLLTPTGLPGGPHPFELLAWYYIGGGDELVNEILEPFGVAVGGIASPAELFAHSNVKLESAADFKGVKFRTMGLWAEILEEFGTSVVTLPGGEIYPAAERGVIDAFEYCPPAQNWVMGFHEITKYVGVPGIHSPSWLSYIVVSHDSWNALPSDLKQLFTDEIKASTIDAMIESWYLDALAMVKYVEYGNEIVTLSDEFQESIAKRSAELCMDMAAKDPVFKKVFDHQAEFFKLYRGVSEVNQPKFTLFDYVD